MFQKEYLQTTLNLMVALSCEAKPLIDFYGLKKRSSSGFSLFCREADHKYSFDINLVVSGIGSQNMLPACAWLAAKTELGSCVWLNIGTAGHANLSLGEIVRVVHSSDNLYDKAFTITNIEERKYLYKTMDSLAMQKSIMVPLYYDEVIRFTRKNVKGLGINPINLLDLKQVRKEERLENKE